MFCTIRSKACNVSPCRDVDVSPSRRVFWRRWKLLGNWFLVVVYSLHRGKRMRLYRRRRHSGWSASDDGTTVEWFCFLIAVFFLDTAAFAASTLPTRFSYGHRSGYVQFVVPAQVGHRHVSVTRQRGRLTNFRYYYYTCRRFKLVKKKKKVDTYILIITSRRTSRRNDCNDAFVRTWVSRWRG